MARRAALSLMGILYNSLKGHGRNTILHGLWNISRHSDLSPHNINLHIEEHIALENAGILKLDLNFAKE